MALRTLTWRRHWRWHLLAAFLALLVLSHVVRRVWPMHGSPRAGQVRFDAPVFDENGAPTGDTTPLYFLDLRPADKPDAPVVLLIHGSPSYGIMFNGLIRELAPDFRLLVPDLPGFGASATPQLLPDYSIAAQARQLDALLVHLNIPRAHVLGYSLGGGAALELAALDPARVQSVLLIASIGVVEHEWTGDPVLNQALYGAQLGLFLGVRELAPHFGYFDQGMLNTAYARNFYDTDQGRIRHLLETYAGPMFIQHGEGDALEPSAAARESHRLVPQSELSLYEGGHLLPIYEAHKVAAPIRDFVQRAHHGLAKVRANADPARLAASIEHMQPGPAAGSYKAMLLGLLALATLLAEDLTCIAAGLLIARGVLGFWPATAATFAGIFIGDLLLYAAGRALGRPALRRRPFRWWIKEEDLVKLGEAFARRGVWYVFFSRFLPGTRLPLFVGAGILHYSFWHFTAAMALSGVLWTPAFIGVAVLVGQPLLDWIEHYEKAAVHVVLLLLVLVIVLKRVALPLCTWRGRRLWLARWRRLTRWEFWPWWLVYAPVFAYVAWLALKHRGLTVFTCANPALPQGGFVEESKSEILRGLGQQVRGAAADENGVARWTLLPAVRDAAAAAARLAVLERWLADERLAWPVVLKPDVGERGQGVAICRGPDRAARYLAENPAAVIAQAYVPGVEYGVFYFRHPGAAAGEILAITDKRFPAVTGDGAHDLEHLILADDRAVCSARFFLAKHRDQLRTVPRAGETVPLVELGTHCRGSLFLDGTREFATPELAAAVDALSKPFAGFFFGRYDIRCPAPADLRAGRRLRVIELNGVTSEATAIYDPRHTLPAAWTLLCRQWRLAFEIGAANRARGAAPATLGHVLRAFFHSRTTEKFEA